MDSKILRLILMGFSGPALLVLFTITGAAQTPRFTSRYTNLKTDCRNAIKLKQAEEHGEDVPLKCRGYGGYEINIGYSATSSQFSINRVGKRDEDVVTSTMQPIDYDLRRKVEW